MMETVLTWVGPGLDLLAVALLGAVLWRLGSDPAAAWGAREERLRAIFGELRGLVAQSEGLARELDAKLATREERLRALLAELASALPAARARGGEHADVDAEAPRAREAGGNPAAIAARIEALAAGGVAVEDIARRVGVAAAEVRLVIGLKAARLAHQRSAASEPADAR